MASRGIKIGVAGCSGRMGLALVRIISGTPGCVFAIGSERPGFDDKQLRAVLAAAGANTLKLTDNPAALVANADAVIDFTLPEHTAELAAEAARRGSVHIIGTTGLDARQQAAIRAAAKKARIVQAANFSLGVNVLEALVQKAASLLPTAYDIEVDEMHHALKKDAPSGTALMLGHAAARGRKAEFDKVRMHYGEGEIGERKPGTIGFSVRRGGDVVGVHTVMYAGPGEVLELTHRAASRDIYAHGAVRAALWAKDRPAGLYSMRDVLGL